MTDARTADPRDVPEALFNAARERLKAASKRYQAAVTELARAERGFELACDAFYSNILGPFR